MCIFCYIIYKYLCAKIIFENLSYKFLCLTFLVQELAVKYDLEASDLHDHWLAFLMTKKHDLTTEPTVELLLMMQREVNLFCLYRLHNVFVYIICDT